MLLSRYSPYYVAPYHPLKAPLKGTRGFPRKSPMAAVPSGLCSG